jgi:hypothetical protein
MSLYGENRDISLFRHLNRELINNIIEQKVGYYKINLDKTPINMYGESAKKIYNDPVLLNCLIERGDTDPKTDDTGMDITRTMKFRFLRDDLAGIDLSSELSNDGKGFTYNDLMDMPIFIRKFFYNRLLEAYEERNEANKKASKKSRR